MDNNTEEIKSLTTTKVNYDTALATMSEEERQQYRAMTSKIKPEDSGSLREFGSEVADVYTRSTDDILRRTHSNAVGDTSAKAIIELNTNLAKQMKEIDIKELSGDMSWFKRLICKIPIIGEKLVISAETLKMKYNPVAENIQEITTALNNFALKGLESNKRLETNRIQVMDAMNQSRKNIIALMVLLDDEQKIYDEMTAHQDQYEMAEIKRKGDFIERVRRKIAGMEKQEYGLGLNLLEIQATYATNEKLADRTDDINSTVMPQWKLQIALAIEQAEQNKWAATQNDIIDAANTMLVENAKALRANQVSAAKVLNRDVFDTETLQRATNEIIAAASDIKRIEENYRSEAMESHNRIQKMYQDIEKAIYIEDRTGL